MNFSPRSSLFCVALALGMVGAASAATEPAKPNIVVIMADDLGFADIGVQGCKDIPTPNIDSLAKNGIICANGYGAPVCSPSRAAFMSGQYQQRTGDEDLVGKPSNKDGLSLTVTTLAQRLKSAGYVTGVVGKWHLGTDKSHHPLARGFDEFYGFVSGGRSYYPLDEKTLGMYMAKPTKGDPRTYRNWDVVKDPPYTEDAFAEEGVQFIKRHQDKPFFLYWASQAPHVPLQPCPRLIEKFSQIKDPTRRTYASMVAGLDDAVGRLLQTLKETGLESKTIIFFLSDNGGPLAIDPNGSNNGPLRGGKFQTWEGGVHVPFFIQWKSVLPAGVVFEPPVIQLDITATAIALAGLKPQPDWKLDGVNLMPYLAGEEKGSPHDALYFRLGKNLAVRAGDFKAVDCVVEPRDPKTAGLMLFNLTQDIGEKNSLNAQDPAKLEQLHGLFQKWAEKVDAEAAAVKKIEPKGDTSPCAPYTPSATAASAKKPAGAPKGEANTKAEERAAARRAARGNGKSKPVPGATPAASAAPAAKADAAPDYE